MQKMQTPTEHTAGAAPAGRAGRQSRRRGAVWLVPRAPQEEATPLANQPSQIVGSLALVEKPEFDAPGDAAPAPTCVLIVEDDPRVASLLHNALKLEGQADWTIDTISDGHAALTRAQESTPNIVLLDVRLPDMDGAEVYHRLRANPATQDCHIVFLTASTALDLSVRGVDGGVLLRKPFDLEQVAALVKALLQDA